MCIYIYILDARWGAEAPQLARYLELRLQLQVHCASILASDLGFCFDFSLRSGILLRLQPQIWDFASTSASVLGFCFDFILRARI